MLIFNVPAKINLFLNIRDKRPDGYHEIVSLMQTIALWDTLVVEPNDSGDEIAFSCSKPELETEDNLVIKAYQKFWEHTGLEPLGVQVHLEKKIPVQAGLGGGSSDAASMLIALNHLSGAGIPFNVLQLIAETLGSDVPFFIKGGTAIATGKGELIRSLPNQLSSVPLLVIKAKDFGISTPSAYQAFDTLGHAQDASIEPLIDAILDEKPTADIENLVFNDFETVLFEQYPLLREIETGMKALGIRRPLLSGSGTAMVGFIPDRFSQESIENTFPEYKYDVFTTQTHSASSVMLQSTQ